VHTSTAKFTHVWLWENENWLLKEVLSFDHHEPQKSVPTKSFEHDIKDILLQEKVPALGLGIIDNGQLTHIKVVGKENLPYNAIFKVASLTKPVTALVALALISDGKLGLDEPLNKYWIDPDLKNDLRVQKLTPRIILSHQTGFPNWRYLTESKKLQFEFEPAAKFQYSGEGFEYLRKALEVKFHKAWKNLPRNMCSNLQKCRIRTFGGTNPWMKRDM
jgi:CubicO group peptidase (beta-lactamase class C family)